MTLGCLVRAMVPLLTMAFYVSACGWTDLDAVAPGTSDAQASDAGAHPRDATDAATQARKTSDASSDDASPDAAASSLPCTRDEVTVYDWTFDSNVEDWALSLDTGVDAGLAWTGDAGYPSLGAVAAHITPQENEGGTLNGGWLDYPHSFGDLTGRTVSAWVWLESGTSPNLKVFAQTGTQYRWADNGTVHLHLRTWTCVSLPISVASYTEPNYDPTNVIDIGFELLGTAPFEVYVDTVRIY